MCLAWNWEYDADLVALLDSACRARGLSLLAVPPDCLDSVLQALDQEQIAIRVLFDRASDTDDRFLGLVQRARRAGVRCINPFDLARCAWDKAAMHDALRPIVPTPHTIMIPPFDVQSRLPALDLAPLGSSFHVKPAHGGGGKGVLIGATTGDQVQAARQEYPHDTYLLQAHVVAIDLGGRPAWFRVICCLEKVFPCWWHPETHLYSPVTAEDETTYGLAPLRELITAIAHVCALELFSSEVALTPEGEFVIVDYVNDPIDLRLQSRAVDGVPDDIVQSVADGLAEFTSRCCLRRA